MHFLAFWAFPFGRLAVWIGVVVISVALAVINTLTLAFCGLTLSKQNALAPTKIRELRKKKIAVD